MYSAIDSINTSAKIKQTESPPPLQDCAPDPSQAAAVRFRLSEPPAAEAIAIAKPDVMATQFVAHSFPAPVPAQTPPEQT